MATKAKKKPAASVNTAKPVSAEKPLMKIEAWAIDKPIPYARNARKIPPEAVAKVASSLKEFGWQQPIVVDTEDVIVVGHTRILAAAKLGMKVVPVHVAKDLTKAQIKAYRLADNRLHEETKWDFEMLAIEMGDLNENHREVDILLTGFGNEEIASFLAESFEVPDYNSPNGAKGEFSIDGQGEAPPPAAEITSHVRMLQVFVPDAEWDKFRADLDALENHFGTSNATDTVMRAVANCVEALPAEDDEEPEEA